jgi:hypothetical protein
MIPISNPTMTTIATSRIAALTLTGTAPARAELSQELRLRDSRHVLELFASALPYFGDYSEAS